MLHQFLLPVAVFLFLYQTSVLINNYIMVIVRKHNSGTDLGMFLFALSGALLVLEITYWI